MRPGEIRGLTTEELERELRRRTEELFNLRFQAMTEQLTNPALVPQLRRDIARLKTILREREQQEAAEAEAPAAGPPAAETSASEEPPLKTKPEASA
jgi:large subunit ribosomal protein L29